MNRQPIAIFSTDWHIKDSNTEEIIDLVIQKCKLAKELGVKYLICLGDVFNSRKSQSLLVLNTFGKILDIVSGYDLEFWCIPGNHDKTNYFSDASFLEPFKTHPNFYLYSNIDRLEFDGITLHFLPFFSEDVWLEKYNEYINTQKTWNIQNILCSHIAVNGSRNNDGSKIQSNINTSIFKEYFDKVFLGHYHNQQKIGSNIYHLPSIQQNNFGEDSEKGFTVLYEDGSHKLIRSQFKQYTKVKIDVNTASKEDLSKMIDEYSKQSELSYIRFILEGSEEKIKSINKDIIRSVGIDVKTVNSEIEIIEDFETVEVKKYTNESILEEFEQFCEEYGKNFETGVSYLKQL